MQKEKKNGRKKPAFGEAVKKATRRSQGRQQTTPDLKVWGKGVRLRRENGTVNQTWVGSGEGKMLDLLAVNGGDRTTKRLETNLGRGDPFVYRGAPGGTENKGTVEKL